MVFAVLATIGLTVFEYLQLSSIEKSLVSFRKIISEQEEMIDELNAERAELKSQNEILNATVGMQQVENQEEQKISEEKHLPTEFPLTGSANLQEQDTEAENYVPMTVFVLSDMSDVIATAEGTVLAVREDTEYGTYISIDHGNGYVSIYRNAGDPKVMEGDEVVRGTILFVGSGDGTQMVYQITKDGEYIDPLKMITING